MLCHEATILNSFVQSVTRTSVKLATPHFIRLAPACHGMLLESETTMGCGDL